MTYFDKAGDEVAAELMRLRADYDDCNKHRAIWKRRAERAEAINAELVAALKQIAEQPIAVHGAKSIGLAEVIHAITGIAAAALAKARGEGNKDSGRYMTQAEIDAAGGNIKARGER